MRKPSALLALPLTVCVAPLRGSAARPESRASWSLWPRAWWSGFSWSVWPATRVAGQQMPTFAPMAPQADANGPVGDLALDLPFRIQFTKPMNESFGGEQPENRPAGRG